MATPNTELPVGFKLSPGNKAEVNTLITCINEWEKFIAIDNTIVIGDPAMMSQNDLPGYIKYLADN